MNSAFSEDGKALEHRNKISSFKIRRLDIRTTGHSLIKLIEHLRTDSVCLWFGRVWVSIYQRKLDNETPQIKYHYDWLVYRCHRKMTHHVYLKIQQEDEISTAYFLPINVESIIWRTGLGLVLGLWIFSPLPATAIRRPSFWIGDTSWMQHGFT